MWAVGRARVKSRRRAHDRAARHSGRGSRFDSIGAGSGRARTVAPDRSGCARRRGCCYPGRRHARSRDAQRLALIERQQAISKPITLDPRAVLVDLQERLKGWRSLLRDNTTKARGLLKQLIVGRIVMFPDDERRVYDSKERAPAAVVERRDPVTTVWYVP